MGLRTALGRLLGLVVGLWARTWRTRVVGAPGGTLTGDQPVVYAFWHGQQMPLLAGTRRRPTAVMVSHSRDGALQTGAMQALGFSVVRGSASRGGAEGLRRLLRALRSGSDAALAVDGPRGPRRRAKAGAAQAASRGGAQLLPVAAVASPRWMVRGSWDEFMVPLPFARVVICVGAPVEPHGAGQRPALLERAIEAAAERARWELVSCTTRS